jgi:indolepyruvate ferredoxin oxidoreductase
VRFAAQPGDIHAQRIATGEADLILGCDLLTAAGADAIAKTRPGRTRALVNDHEQPPGHFARNPDWQYPASESKQWLMDATGGQAEFVNATRLATGLLGDAMGANLFMLGLAYQRGLVPLQLDSLLRAIELNAVAVPMNKAAFAWGRRAALNPQEVAQQASPQRVISLHKPQRLEALLQTRAAFLTAYQNAAYAQRYLSFVERVQQAEQAAQAGDALSKAVASNLFKLMSYKDEYEVARLFTLPEFQQALANTFEGDYTLSFHLAPPWLSPHDAQGRLVKRRFPGATMLAFKLLAKLRFLRGTVFDVFGRTTERREERQLVTDYEHSLMQVLPVLTPDNRELVLALARLPERIRGFGHVKAAAMAIARAKQQELLEQVRRMQVGSALVEDNNGAHEHALHL